MIVKKLLSSFAAALLLAQPLAFASQSEVKALDTLILQAEEGRDSRELVLNLVDRAIEADLDSDLDLVGMREFVLEQDELVLSNTQDLVDVANRVENQEPVSIILGIIGVIFGAGSWFK